MAARKVISEDQRNEARVLRRQGKTIDQVADALGVSFGSAQKLCRGVARPVVRRAEGENKAVKKPVEGSTITAHDTSRVLGRVEESERVVELANEVKEAELEVRKIEAEAKIRRQKAETEAERQRAEDEGEVRKQLKLAEVREVEARTKSYSSNSPEIMAQVEAAKAESAKLREELNEAWHKAEMDTLQHGFQSQIDALKELFKGRDKNGKSSYDVMSQLIDKVNQTGMMIGSKIDAQLSRRDRDSEFIMGLQLGLSPAELQILKAGPEAPMSKAQYDIVRGDRSIEDYGPYEWWLAETELHNAKFRELSQRVSQRLASSHGDSQRTKVVVPGGQPGQSAPEPAVAGAMSAVSKVVDIKCSHCGKLVSLDLLDFSVRQSAFGKCPECGCTIDISSLTGAKPEKPDCYRGEGGSCMVSSSERTSMCNECAWK